MNQNDSIKDFSQFTDFDDFCQKNNFSYRQGIDYLDNILKKQDDAK